MPHHAGMRLPMRPCFGLSLRRHLTLVYPRTRVALSDTGRRPVQSTISYKAKTSPNLDSPLRLLRCLKVLSLLLFVFVLKPERPWSCKRPPAPQATGGQLSRLAPDTRHEANLNATKATFCVCHHRSKFCDLLRSIRGILSILFNFGKVRSAFLSSPHFRHEV